tara:strand:- start:620 stop:856 length:237 start_codon:yes stop_codon:yes gene_type:complete
MITITKGWYLLLSELKKNSELELIIKIKKKTVKNFTSILFIIDEPINKIEIKIRAANKLANDTENPQRVVPSLTSPFI